MFAFGCVVLDFVVDVVHERVFQVWFDGGVRCADFFGMFDVDVVVGEERGWWVVMVVVVGYLGCFVRGFVYVGGFFLV